MIGRGLKVAREVGVRIKLYTTMSVIQNPM